MKVVEINEKKYIIEAFGGVKGFKIKQKLVKLLAPALEAFKSSKETDSDDQSLMLIADAVQSVLETTEDDGIFNLLTELMTAVKTENGSIDFNEEFKQNYVSLYKLAKEVIMYNYQDVFQALGMNAL